MAREMILETRQLRGKHDALGRNRASACFLSEVAHRRVTTPFKPQQAAFNGMQQSHPAVEAFGRDLVMCIEAAEHEPLGGQSMIRTGLLTTADRVPITGW